MCILISLLPVIRAEGEEGEIGGILHVAELEIAEAVADGNRSLHLGTGELDGLVPVATARLPEMLSRGRMEDTVLARQLETPDILEGRISMIVVLQMDVDGIALD